MDESAPRQQMLPLFNFSCSICRTFDPGPANWGGGLRAAATQDRGLLCTSHRARSEEGSCVLCGRRLPWKYVGSKRRLGFCLPCLDRPEDPRRVVILQVLREFPTSWDMSE